MKTTILLSLVGLVLCGPATFASETPASADRKINVALGRMGSKASALLPDLVQRLRNAVSRELQDTPGVRLISDGAHGGFAVESSVTELTRRTTPTGEIEVTCEVSMVISSLPTRAIVSMTSGGATVSVSSGHGKLPRAAMEAIEADALDHAVHGAHENLVAFLRNHQ